MLARYVKGGHVKRTIVVHLPLLLFLLLFPPLFLLLLCIIKDSVKIEAVFVIKANECAKKA